MVWSGWVLRVFGLSEPVKGSREDQPYFKGSAGVSCTSLPGGLCGYLKGRQAKGTYNCGALPTNPGQVSHACVCTWYLSACRPSIGCPLKLCSDCLLSRFLTASMQGIRACVGFLWALWLSPKVQKNMLHKLICVSELPLGVHVSVYIFVALQKTVDLFGVKPAFTRQ